MKTNSLFFIFFAAIFFTPTQYIHGMLAKRTHIPSTPRISSHMFGARMCTTQNFRIVPYNPEQHEKDIIPIVSQNVHRLMSGVTDHNRDKSTQEAMGAINNITEMKSYVCLAHSTDEPIGIINYFFCDQPYKPFTHIFNLDIPQNAVIQMLAVDEKHQGKKIGSALLQHALKDCEQQRVYKATLGTTSLTLHKFYQHHGFTCTWDGQAIRSPNSEFTKWFQPDHPLKAAASAMFMAWFNNQHKK